MKTVKGFGALLLALTLALACMPAAAETGYIGLRDYLSDAESAEDLYIGDAERETPEEAEDGKTVRLAYDTVTGVLTLTGVNEAGNPEKSVWKDVPAGDALYLFYRCCVVWEELAAIFEEGTSFVMTLPVSEQEWVIDGPEQAAAFVQWTDEQLRAESEEAAQ